MNGGRVLGVAKHELRTHLASPLLWGLVAFTMFATLAVNPAAMIPSGNSAIGGVQPFSNSVYAMAQVFSLTGLLFYTFLASILSGMSIINDDEVGIGDLIHSTPLTAAEYVAGKLGGVISALGVVLLLHVSMAVAWYQFGPLVGGDAVQGPFHFTNYLLPALLFIGPGLLFCAGVTFAVGERTRAPIAVYVVPTVLFFVTLTALIPRPASAFDPLLGRFFAVFDLWGSRWLSQTVFTVDRGVDFYNHAPLAIDPAFLRTRVFLLVVSAVAVLSSVRHCRRAIRGSQPVRHHAHARACATPEPARRSFSSLRDLRMTSRQPGFIASSWEVTQSELQQLRMQPALYLLFVLAALLVWDHTGSVRGVFDSAVILRAGSIAVGLVEMITVVGCLLLLFHTVESISRATRSGVHAILYATPVSTTAMLLGIHIAGALLIAVMLVGCVSVSLLALVLQPQGELTTWPLVLVWGVILAPTFLVWITFVTAVFALVRDRYTTYVVAFAALAGTAVLLLTGAMTWVSNWALWGALRWSDMGAFELNGEALWLNRVLMTCLAVVFQVIAVRMFARTERDTMATLAAFAPRRLAGHVARLALLALLPMACGVYLALRIDLGFQGDAAKKRTSDYWRLNVAAWSGVNPPTLTRADVKVDLEPDARTMHVSGTFTMLPPADAPLRQIAFTVGASFENVRWTLNDTPINAVDRSGLHVLALPDALSPSQTLDVGFSYTAVFPSGVTRNGGGTSEFILPSGVVLNTLGPNFLPIPGFISDLGREADVEDGADVLPEDFWQRELPPLMGNASAFTTRMEVSAPQGFIVNGVGELTHQQTIDGRTTVVWESDYPVKFLNLLAGRWAVRRQEGVAVFHHVEHGWNVDEMLATLAAARARYSAWFYPYPWRELKLSEYPAHATRAQGFPTNISFSEDIGFLTRSGPSDRLSTIVAAHEAAHQWWGNLITPARGPGADVLIEGLANYSTMLLLEAEQGVPARIDFATRLETRYARTRRVDAERPLVMIVDSGRASDETVIDDKGAWVMWMLQQHLGRDQMLAGLRTFMRQFVNNPDHAALQDLIETLRPFASDPQAYQAFVNQWVFDVVVPEFRLTDVTTVRVGDQWTLFATIENIGSGAVAVELAAVEGDRDARTRVDLAAGKPQQISWIVPFRPSRVVVDADALVLQLNRARAVAAVQ